MALSRDHQVHGIAVRFESSLALSFGGWSGDVPDHAGLGPALDSAFSSAVAREEDMKAIFEATVSIPVKYELLYCGEWKQNLLLANLPKGPCVPR